MSAGSALAEPMVEVSVPQTVRATASIICATRRI
jgi:hypothetical protein